MTRIARHCVTSSDQPHFISRMLSRAVLSLVVASLVWAAAPCALGWHAHVVVTGSMSPEIKPGDVVVSSPVAGRDVSLGEVIVFVNPANPEETLVHRVVARTSGGELITRGDANARPDSSPVPAALVKGRARMRVPAIGLPELWLRQRRLGFLAIMVVTLVVAGARASTTRGQAQPRLSAA